MFVKLTYIIRGIDKILQVYIPYWNSLVWANKCFDVAKLVIFRLKYKNCLANSYISKNCSFIIYLSASRLALSVRQNYEK